MLESHMIQPAIPLSICMSRETDVKASVTLPFGLHPLSPRTVASNPSIQASRGQVSLCVAIHCSAGQASWTCIRVDPVHFSNTLSLGYHQSIETRTFPLPPTSLRIRAKE